MNSVLLCASVLAQGQWSRQQSGTTANLRGVWFADSLNGWACGDSGVVLRTSNGGNSWSRQNSGVNMMLEDVFFQSITTGWMAGDSGVVISTTNSGTIWVRQGAQGRGKLRYITFSGLIGGVYDGLIVGDTGTINHTTDGGRTWQGGRGVFGTRNLDCIAFKELFRWVIFFEQLPNNGWSRIWRTTNGGIGWDTLGNLRFPRVLDLYTLVRSNTELFYWIATKRGGLFTSTNAGSVWRVGLMESPDTTIDFNGITLDTLTWKLWAVGGRGRIASSSDSGKNWQHIPTSVATNLNEVAFPARDVGWAVGDSGVILHYSLTLGVRESMSFAPGRFDVGPAYPNPCNPKTRVEIHLPRQVRIVAGVFDILGREAKPLLDEIKQAGAHSLEIDAGSLPSGVYFLRVSAGNRTKIAKLVLIK